jgi:membrane protein YdbS with pleckstrin-like domain
MSAAPDLTTPEGRAAYRRELNAVARPLRWSGIALALIGAAIGATRFFMAPWPDWIRWLALVLCLAGIVLMGVGVVQRTRYHLARIAGTDASNAR